MQGSLSQPGNGSHPEKVTPSPFDELINKLRVLSNEPAFQISVIERAYKENAQNLALVLVKITSSRDAGTDPSLKDILHEETLVYLKKRFPFEDKHGDRMDEVRADVKDVVS